MYFWHENYQTIITILISLILSHIGTNGLINMNASFHILTDHVELVPYFIQEQEMAMDGGQWNFHYPLAKLDYLAPADSDEHTPVEYFEIGLC